MLSPVILNIQTEWDGSLCCGTAQRLPGYCCCRRPQGPCAHRCYLFPCARSARGQCCVRVPRLGVRGAKQPHAVRRQEPPRAASSSTISEPVRARARLAGPPANARRFCSVAPPMMWARYARCAPTKPRICVSRLPTSSAISSCTAGANSLCRCHSVASFSVNPKRPRQRIQG